MTTEALPARPLGPGGVLWYSAGDHRQLAVAIRLLLHQVAHPMVGAGVEQQSVYKTDPYGRLWRTTRSVVTSVYGGNASAAEGMRLIRMHADISGTDSRGRPYRALDKQAYAWVHWTSYETTRMFLRDFGPGLTEEQDLQLFEEWRRLGLLLGVRADQIPDTREEFWQGWAEMLPKLEDNPVVQDLLYSPPRAPHLLPFGHRIADSLLALAARPLLGAQRDLISVTVDDGLRERIGLRAPTDRMRRRVARIQRLSRLGNRLPAVLRMNPVAYLRSRRTQRDGVTLPEPIRYP